MRSIKFLLDPYGKAFDGVFDGHPSLHAFGEDTLGHTMTTVVINPFFDWGADGRRARRTTRPSSTRLTSRA